MNWTSNKVYCQNSPIGGKGNFALQKIKQGETVIVFGGDVIEIEEFLKLPKQVQTFPYQISDKLFFGPTKVENVDSADYINHSCDPNVGFNGPMMLVAMRDISKDEELTFDYATCMTSAIIDMNCDCGLKNCRVKITGEDWKKPELQKRYKGFFQPYIERKINGLMPPQSFSVG